MPKCKICGTRIDIGTAVCPSCGAKVVSSSAVPDAGINANAAARTAKARVSSTTQVIKTTCAHCGAEVIGEHRFCPQCGVNLKEAAEENKKGAAEPRERRCPHCGSVVQANSRFCPDCGKTLVVSSAKATPAQQAAPVTKASSPAPATTNTGNASKLRISLIPESLTEMTAYFDSVQDFCSSPEAQDMSGSPTLAVDGELTEDELDSIVDLVEQGRKVKTFDLSSCKNVRQLKDEQFFAEKLFKRCAGLETVRLPDGRTLTQGSTKKATPRKNTTPKKKGKGLLIAAILIGGIACIPVIKGIQNTTSIKTSPLIIIDGKVKSVKDKNIVSVEIPNTVTAIEENAFQGCALLASIIIPDSVNSIGSQAFYGCSSLTKVNIPNSVTSIGNNAFFGCSSLTSISLPNSVVTIRNHTFYDCSSLTEIHIPNSINSIGEWSFFGCRSLKSINIPSSVTFIGEGAFGFCTSLTSINIPNSVDSIREKTFLGCSSLTSVNIPNSVTAICKSAFQKCTSLTSMTIPNSVTSINTDAFSQCTSLRSLHIPNSVNYFGITPFYRCEYLTVTCPKGSYAEQYCKKNYIRYITQ